MKIDIDAQARLRALVKTAGSQKEAAEQLGFSQAYVNDLLKGRRVFSEPILEALGLRRTVIEASQR